MNIHDINDIIKAVCPNDEDYEKPCISPKYLRQELEQLALDQEQNMLEHKPEEPITENCIACKYDETEEEDGAHCKKCLAGNSQFELDKEFVEQTTKNNLAQERYQDLIEYFGSKEIAKTILGDRKKFKAWLERLRWNVKRADELARELEQIKGTTKNDLAVDAVSRQVAIDAIRRIHPIDTDYDCTLLDKDDVMYVLNDLPSATPQLSSELAKNSKKLEKNFGELDCISRADAIRVASGYCHPSNVAKELAKLPSVTPQEQEPVLDKIKEDVKKWYWQADKQKLAEDPCVVDAMIDLFIRTIDKYKAENNS